MIIRNNKTTSALYKGTKEIIKRYKGTLVVYEAFKKLITSGVPPITLQKCKGVNLVDYKIYGGTTQGKLLSTYQQVEYIESSGTQYIDTGIAKWENGTKFELDMKFKSSTTRCLMGYSPNVGFYFGKNEIDNYEIGSAVTMDLLATERRICTFYRDNTNAYLEVDGNTISRNVSTTGSEQTNFSTYLAGYSGNGAIIYNIKAYKDDVLLRDMIPCYRKSDNVIGMYDLVENKFYINAGTGTFVKGSDTPTPNTPIEVESVGDKTPQLLNLPTNGEINWYGGLTSVTGIRNKDGSITFNGVGDTEIHNTNKLMDNSDTFTIQETGIYAFSCKNANTSLYMVVGIPNDSGGKNYHTINNDNVTHLSLEKNTIVTVYLQIGANKSLSNLTLYPMAQKVENVGDVVSEYESYGYRIPVKVSGKNKFNTSTYETVGDGTGHNYMVKLPEVKENTRYNFSCVIESMENIESTGAALVVVRFTYTDGTTLNIYPVTNSSVVGQRSSGSSSANKTIYSITIFTNTFLKNGTIKLKEIQLEEGTTATDFEPYYKPITTNIYLKEPLRKINNYADYIDFEKGQVVRKIFNEYMITVGSKSSVSKTYSMFLNDISHKPLLDTNTATANTGYCVSNKFQKSLYGYGVIPEHPNIIQTYITNSKINKVAYTFDDSSINTVELAQEKIGDGFEVNYILEEEITEDITLPNILLNKGTNIIEVDTDILPSNMEVEYYGKE